MKQILLMVNMAVGLILVVLILLQGKGAGLGSAWGGGGEYFQTRRGLEKVTLQLTVAFVVIFFILSLIIFIYK